MPIRLLVQAFVVAALASLPHTAAAQPQQRDLPYEVLPSPADPAPLLQRLGERSNDAWLDGDTLHFARRSAEGPVQLAGGLQLPMQKVRDSDLWVASVRWEHWPEAFLSYTFITPQNDGKVTFERWRGDNAPELPAPTEREIDAETIELWSDSLGEARNVTVALPPGEHRGLPVIVLADGQSAEPWARLLFPIMESGRMRPAAIVGIHSVHYRGDRAQPYDPSLDIRTREYIETNDPERFALHLRWVTDEALPHLAEQHGLSLRREDLVVAGFSNGGSFAASAALRRPDVFGGVLGLSIGVPPQAERPEGPLPKFRVAAGELEPGFLKASRETVDLVRGWGGDATLRTFKSGHDHAMWELAVTLAPELLPPRPAAD